MLHVTTEAKCELRERLLELIAARPRGLPAELGFRLVAGENEEAPLGLALDLPRQGDEVIVHDGRSVLMLDAGTARILEDLTLDVVDTPEGVQLGLLERSDEVPGGGNSGHS